MHSTRLTHLASQAPAYRAVHKKLVSQSGCLICGVTNDILKDRARRANLSLNPYGALQL